MRVIPVITRIMSEKSDGDVALLLFVTVYHPQLESPLRLVVDGADYVIGGSTYFQSYFELDLLTDEERPPEARFRFPNVDREAITRLRTVSGPCRVEFAMLAASYFDLSVEPRVETTTVVWSRAPSGSLMYLAEELFLTEVNIDQESVEGTLRSWDYRQENWPDVRVTKKLLPGVYTR